MAELHTCNNCGKPINGDKWCSDKCRMAYKRTFGKAAEPEHLPEQKLPEHEQIQAERTNPNKPEDWRNSAETKTKAEIEAHYSSANFPVPKYHSVNGGGAGSYSPYPKSDPRSKAYSLT